MTTKIIFPHPPKNKIYSIFLPISEKYETKGGSRRVMAIVLGNEHGDPSSNREQSIGKCMNPTILPSAMSKS